MRTNKFGISLAASTLALAVSCGAHAVTDEDILNDHKTPEDVVSYGMGVQGQRYSPITDLNNDNVQHLQPAWAFSFGGEKQRGQESQPLIKDGVMYVTASYSRAYAVDARTGEELYRFNTGSGIVGTPVTWTMDGEQYLSVSTGWGGAVPLWGGEVAKVVKNFNQGGTVWTFKLPKNRIAAN